MKKMLKKSLAVFMTAMMIMTAWVFVAPQVADAVTVTALADFPATGQALEGRYKLTSNKTITSTTTASGYQVAANKTALIYIAKGVTLTIQGGTAINATSGKAGILMASTATLYITGPGKLVVKGGNGASGVSGTKGSDSSGAGSAGGGAGGAGGGGGGAGIGGNGATGGTGGSAGNSGGGAGGDGSNGSNGDAGGKVYILDSLASVSTTAGSAGESGGAKGGQGGKNAGGGGGGGGGNGSGGAAIGGGGGSGAGGGGGAGGDGSLWWKKKGNGGKGGKGVSKNGADADNGETGTAGSGGSSAGSNGSAGTFSNKQLTVTSAPTNPAKGQITLYRNEGTVSDTTATSYTAYQTIGYDMQNYDTTDTSKTFSNWLTPTRAGYDYQGYWTSSTLGSGVQYYTDKGASARAYDYYQLNLYAQWKPFEIDVTLDCDNTDSGKTTGTTNLYYKYDTELGKVNSASRYYTTDKSDWTKTSTWVGGITRPTRIGYTFGGYYTKQNGEGTQYINAQGQFVNDLYKVYNWADRKVTLYAKWTPVDLTITYKNIEGQVIGTTTGKYDARATDYTQPTYPEYPYQTGQTGTFKYNPEYYYVTGAKKYTTANSSTQVEIFDANGTKDSEYILKGDTEFTINYGVEKKDYTVTFTDANGQNTKKTDYHYNDVLTVPSAKAKTADDTYTYEFKGWTSANPDGEQYRLLEPNSNKDSEGRIVPIIITADYSAETAEKPIKVTTNVDYVAVYQKVYKNYTVTFKYKDATGGDVTVSDSYHFGDEVDVPEYDSEYKTGGYTYPLDSWKKNGTVVTLGDKVIVDGNATYAATYGEGVPAVYDIKFVNDGEIISDEQILHGQPVVVPTDPTKADDDNYRYNFKGWSESENGEIVDPVTIAGADKTYYAVYDLIPLYSVTWYNEGEEIGTAKEIAGNPVPTFGGDTPTKPADEYSEEYTFDGFRDSDGNEVTTMPESGLTLYAHYSYTLTDYTVKFVSDGETVSEKTYHYGDEITIPADPTKAKDDTYTYIFRGWDKTVSETCNGTITYTALYRKAYRNYRVEWLNDDGSIFSAEYYHFGSRVNPPRTVPAPINTKTEKENTSLIFDYWEDTSSGQPLVRGDNDVVNGNMTFIVHYDEVLATKTITFLNEDGSEFAKVDVKYGTYLDKVTYSNPSKAPTTQEHYAFDAWLDSNGEAVDPATTQITTDISFKASFKAEEHEYELTEVTVVPTFWQEGEAVWTCSADGCGLEKKVTVEKLKDEKKPEGRIFIRDNAWNTVYDVDFDNATPVSLFNIATIATSDKANHVDTFNVDGQIGSGVAKLEYAVATSPAQVANVSTIENWTTAFEIADEEKEVITGENVNVSSRLDQMSGIPTADGDKFILIAKLTDRMGNVGYQYTGTLVLDSTAPVVTVTSDNSNGKSKHCVEATISASDNNAIESVTLDGEIIELENGSYKTTKAGVHQVSVTDKAGNTTSVNFEIIGAHSLQNQTVAATCTRDGYVRQVCKTCGEIISETVLEKTGHQKNETPVVTPATCTEDEVQRFYCKVCGELLEEKVIENTKINHDFREYFKKAATCVSEGVLEEICLNCNEIRTTVLPIDPNAHVYYRAVTVEPTCTTAGETYQLCKHCGFKNVIEQGEDDKAANFNAALAPTGHDFTGEEVITVAATCTKDGAKAYYCTKGCTDEDGNKLMGIMDENGKAVAYRQVEVKDEDGNVVDYEFYGAEIIKATGHHFVATVVQEPTTEQQGIIKYICSVCGAESGEVEYIDKIEKFTVTFESGAASNNKVEITKIKGETITADDITIDTAKPADASNSYVFDHWADGVGNEVSLPLTVTENITIHAEYRSRAIYYNVILHREDDTVYYKIGYNTNGSTVDLSAYNLSKASDETKDYEFVGWSATKNDTTGSGSVIINGANVDLYPVFKGTDREFTVVFALDNASPALDTVTVLAGRAAIYGGSTPKKDYDDAAHYEFSGWSEDTSNVTKDMLVYATFKAIPHDKTPVSEVAATCTSEGKVTYKCECGYETTVTTPKTGHTLSDQEIEKDGKLGWECLVCHEFIVDDNTYTVRFINDDDSAVKSIYFIEYGEDISAKVPASAEKASDGEYNYTFSHWSDTKGGDKVTVATVVKGDATYYAVYTAEPIVHTVFYRFGDTVYETKHVKNGDAVIFTGDSDPERTDGANDYGHFEFAGWSQGGESGYVEHVTSNLNIEAKWTRVAHTWKYESTTATCTDPVIRTGTCTVCGYKTVPQQVAPANGHSWVLVETVGFTQFYVCSVCGATKTETLPDTTVIVRVEVKDDEGNPVSGAKVSLYDGNTFVTSGKTDENGIVEFRVEPKEYRIVIESANGQFADQTGTIKVNGDGSSSMSGISIPHYHCSCACHKDGIWGSIFRFFHKIIKLFTGKFNCCNDPDPRY